MNKELKPPTTQEEAIKLLDELISSASAEEKLMAYTRLKELFCLLLPE